MKPVRKLSRPLRVREQAGGEFDVEMFIRGDCPYCVRAVRYLDELKKEGDKYQALRIKLIDERAERALANARDYYYVPTCYVAGEKLHEGAATKEQIRGVLEKALDYR